MTQDWPGPFAVQAGRMNRDGKKQLQPVAHTTEAGPAAGPSGRFGQGAPDCCAVGNFQSLCFDIVGFYDSGTIIPLTGAVRGAVPHNIPGGSS